MSESKPLKELPSRGRSRRQNRKRNPRPTRGQAQAGKSLLIIRPGGRDRGRRRRRWRVVLHPAKPQGREARPAEAAKSPGASACPGAVLRAGAAVRGQPGQRDRRTARYLQVEVQLMTRDPESLKAIKLHAPAIRARLLMLFAQQDAASLMSPTAPARSAAGAGPGRSAEGPAQGRDRQARSDESLLFTSFVTQ
jgi:hypothetical protein